MDSSSIQSSTSSRRICKYDVFLSFRGDDTRNKFTDHLYSHLIRKGIFTFKDDQRLEKGQPISAQLLQAIRDSRVSIVVFSRDYAASTWCLEEMAAIVDCREELRQAVFPVFYGVDPSHVRNQSGAYEDAFILHTERFKEDPGKVGRWRRAMTHLANSAGWDVRDKPEFGEIEKIVQKVIKILDNKFSGFADDLIGIQPHVERKAFKRVCPSNNCEELIPEVLKYAQSLPLTIKVVGSFLCTRNATQWRDALDRLRSNLENKITDVLQMSLGGLEPYEKEIFLHIACFFRGEREDYVKQILDACGLHPHIGIPVITEKSLITIRNQEIHMHEMLQELGKKIVREKYPEEPGSWSRLWHYKNFHHVLMSETGTNNIKAIVLNEKEDVSNCSHLRVEGLSKMRGLKLLILYQKKFSGSLNFLPNCLQYLLWHGYPFYSLPLNFEPHDSLVELNLPGSSIKRLWEGRKYLPSLKRIDLSNSKFLEEMPDIGKIPNLERLDLAGCTSLCLVPSSIRLHENLAFLSLRNCCSLVYFNFNIPTTGNMLRYWRDEILSNIFRPRSNEKLP